MRTLATFLLAAGCVVAAQAGETLSNGIVLPDVWPPRAAFDFEPMRVPYLEAPPAVIPINDGRQLFVDDFLIERTTLVRKYHVPRTVASPVLQPEMPWESGEDGNWAAPYSDGVWHDPADGKFKMWYRAAERRTCYAESTDGIEWTRPKLDVVPGTNVVLTSENKASQRDSNTVWLDLETKDPAERFKLFEARYARAPYCFGYRTSADGIHWSAEQASGARSWDRTTAFYNPFRKVWVASVRGHDHEKPAPAHRLRNYFEAPTAAAVVQWKQPTDDVAKGNVLPDDLVPWVGADRLDPHHPDPRHADVRPQIYNLDVFRYESLLVGLFTIWQGPTNELCKELDLQKRNEVFVGFTRDGFHWHRPLRTPFLPVSDDPLAWNAANVQSVGGGCVVVDDQLRFYYSGRRRTYHNVVSTGMAILERDRFASMDAPSGGGELTTRPVRFSGTTLYVNAFTADAELRVEMLDVDGRVLDGFGRDDCVPFKGYDSHAAITWRDGRDLSALRDRPVRLQFLLGAGELLSFDIPPSPAGGFAQ